MGWVIDLQLIRARPLTTSERATLRATLRAINRWPWEGGGLPLELPAKPVGNGLLARARVQVPLDPFSDAERIHDAAEAFVAAIPELEARVDDSFGPGTDPVELLDEGEVDWVPALPEPPTALPEKLVKAIRALERGPDEAALQVLRTDAGAGKLIERMSDDKAPEAEQEAARDALRHVDPDTLYAAALKRFRKLGARGHILLRDTAEGVTDIPAAAVAFLGVWKKGSGRYHWNDFVTLTPEPLLARIAREPAVHAQLVADLAEALDNPDEVTACSRGAAAAQMLGRARTVQAAAALLPHVARLRRVKAKWEYADYMPRGFSAGLAWMALGPIEAGPGFSPPVATILLRLGELSSNVGDSHRELLRAFAKAAPERAWPILLTMIDRGLWTDAAIPALEQVPGEPARTVLGWLVASPNERVSDLAIRALITREGPAGVPTWLAAMETRAKPDFRSPDGLSAHGVDFWKAPKSAEGWRAWMAERGLAPVPCPRPPAEEWLMHWDPLRAGLFTRDPWREALQGAAADPTLIRTLLLGWHLFKRREGRVPFPLESVPELAPLAGSPFPEQLAALDARADLPPQRTPLLLATYTNAPELLLELASSWGFPETKAGKAALLDEEKAWWTAHVGGEMPVV